MHVYSGVSNFNDFNDFNDFNSRKQKCWEDIHGKTYGSPGRAHTDFVSFFTFPFLFFTFWFSPRHLAFRLRFRFLFFTFPFSFLTFWFSLLHFSFRLRFRFLFFYLFPFFSVLFILTDLFRFTFQVFFAFKLYKPKRNYKH